MTTNDLRVRLEGRLEVLETVASHLEPLDALLRSRGWANSLTDSRRLLNGWLRVQPQLEEAAQAVRRANVEDVFARLARARARLAEATGLPPRTERPLAEATVVVRSAAWAAIVLVALGMVGLSRFWAAACLLVIGAVAWCWLKRLHCYRLFADVLVLEREGEANIEVPLRSLQQAKALAGMTLQGLVDIELPANESVARLPFPLRRQQLAGGWFLSIRSWAACTRRSTTCRA